MSRSRLVLALLILGFAGPTSDAAAAGSLRVRDVHLKPVGDATLVRGQDGRLLVVAQTRRGLILRASRGGAFGRPVRLARPRHPVVDLSVATDRSGAVLVAWVIDDESDPADEDIRDDSRCCRRLYAGGLDARGRVVRGHPLTVADNVAGVDTTFYRGRRYVLGEADAFDFPAAPPTVFVRGRDGWRASRTLGRSGNPGAMRLTRLGGRLVVVGTVVSGGEGHLRTWPVAGGRPRSYADYFDAREVAGATTSGRGLLAMFRGAAFRGNGFSAVRLLPGTRRVRARLAGGGLYGGAVAEAPGALAVVGVRSPPRAVIARVRTARGWRGGWRPLGRLGFVPSRYDVSLTPTLSRTGTVSAWSTDRVPRAPDTLVRLRRTPRGRSARARVSLPGAVGVVAATTDARGRSVALVSGRRLWVVR